MASRVSMYPMRRKFGTVGPPVRPPQRRCGAAVRTGSIPSSRAISSSTVSEANAAIGAPGARYAAVLRHVGDHVIASMKKFGTSYGAKMHIHPGLTAEPLNAPAV